MSETNPSIWAVRPVAKEHTTELTAWRAFVITGPGSEHGTLHLTGYVQQLGEGRVSSPVSDFDPAARTARSSSGRTYLLVGPTGHHSDAEYVWSHWLRLKGTNEADVKEVSSDLQRRTQEAAQ